MGGRGLFGFLRRTPRVSAAQVPEIVAQIDRRLEATREQFVFAALSSLKGEGLEVPGIPKLLEEGTEVDSALRGFQLTTVVGFCWKYMDRVLCEPFDDALTRRMNSGGLETISRFRERYLDCEGNIERLSRHLAEDIHRLWGAPEPTRKVIKGLEAGAHVLAVLSQAGAAAALGDLATERKLKGLISAG